MVWNGLSIYVFNGWGKFAKNWYNLTRGNRKTTISNTAGKQPGKEKRCGRHKPHLCANLYAVGWQRLPKCKKAFLKVLHGIFQQLSLDTIHQTCSIGCIWVCLRTGYLKFHWCIIIFPIKLPCGPYTTVYTIFNQTHMNMQRWPGLSFLIRTFILWLPLTLPPLTLQPSREWSDLAPIEMICLRWFWQPKMGDQWLSHTTGHVSYIAR